MFEKSVQLIRLFIRVSSLVLTSYVNMRSRELVQQCFVDYKLHPYTHLNTRLLEHTKPESMDANVYISVFFVKNVDHRHQLFFCFHQQ